MTQHEAYVEGFGQKILAFLIAEFALLSYWYFLRKFPDDEAGREGRARARHFARWSRKGMWKGEPYRPPEATVKLGGKYVGFASNVRIDRSCSDGENTDRDTGIIPFENSSPESGSASVQDSSEPGSGVGDTRPLRYSKLRTVFDDRDEAGSDGEHGDEV